MHNHRFFLFCFLCTLLHEAAFAQTQQDFPNQPELHWKYSTNAPIYASPVVWTFKTVGHRYFPKGEVQGSPAIAINTIIIGARDYNVYALDKEKGYAHWNKAFTKGWVLSNTYIY